MKREMKMPGFTAEASLYQQSKHYNLGVNPGAHAEGQVVIPQYDYCLYHYGDVYGPGRECYLHCIQNPICSESKCRYVCDYVPPTPPPPIPPQPYLR